MAASSGNNFGYGRRFARPDAAAKKPKVTLSSLKTRTSRKTKLRITNINEFYVSPYLTCRECNAVSFINSFVLEKALFRDPSNGDDYINLEALPACSGCGRRHTFEVGARDFSHLIEMDKEALRRLRIARRKNAIKIQSLVRGINGRKKAAKVLADKLAVEERRRYAATAVQAVWRGRYDRRAARIERELKAIREAKPAVLMQALVNKFGQVKVYWYKNVAQLKLLYADYRLLVSRTGGQPPLYKVERNIHEIFRRIEALHAGYATQIQKVVRGVICRAFFRDYVAETARLHTIRTAAAFIIQRAYYGWRHRVAQRRMRVARWKQSMLAQYREESAKGAKEARLRRLKRRVTDHYVLERRQEQTARYTGKLAFGACGGKKMVAFARSEYGNPKVNRVMREYLSERKLQAAEEAEAEQRAYERLVRIRGKIRAHPAFALYYTAELREGRATFMRNVEHLQRFSVIKNK